MKDILPTIKLNNITVDRISEPQDWIDGLVIEYSPNSEDIDVALQNMGLKIAALQDLCIWMTGCGYDFNKHRYFRTERDRLLKNVYNYEPR